MKALPEMKMLAGGVMTVIGTLAGACLGVTDLRAEMRTLGLDRPYYPPRAAFDFQPMMNTHEATTAGTIAGPSPMQRIQRLALRALAAFPECTLTWSLIVEWCKEHGVLQRRWSREALAIDDEMEREAPLLAECLENDPPAKRRRVWAAWKETHRRTRALAAELDR